MSAPNWLIQVRAALDEVKAATQRAFRVDDFSAKTSELSQLEERILMSASPVAVVADPAADSAQENPEAANSEADDVRTADDAVALLDELTEDLIPSADAADGTAVQLSASQEQTQELIFIDSRVSNFEQVIAELQAQNVLDDSRVLDVVVLDAQRDGIAQITSALLEHDAVDGIHVVSHGSDGQVQLGSTTLSMENLDRYRSAISGWQYSLSEDADILIYGCNVAESLNGQQLLNQLGDLTGADVAGSDDLTGHADLGGNWILEYSVGDVSTDVAFGYAAQASWHSTLNISTDLVMHHTFDKDETDSSGNGYDSNLAGGALIDNNGVTNKIGDGKLRLDGSDDFAGFSSHIADFQGITEGTISAWIYHEADSKDVIFETSDSSDFDSRLVLFRTSTGALNFYINEEDTTLLDVSTADNVIDTDTWTHVAVTVNSSGNKLYVNGVQQSVTYAEGSATTNLFFDDVPELDFGSWGVDKYDGSNYARHFEGFIDDGRVYDRALSGSDITALYNVGGIAPASTIWLTTLADVASPSGAPGLDSWSEQTVIEMGGPNLEFEPEAGNSDGTFSTAIDFENFAGISGDVDAIHYVGSAVTVGGVDLQAGDVLFSIFTNMPYTSLNSVNPNPGDVYVFQPTTAGDYSSGTFSQVIDASDLGIGGITAFSLVESDVTVGGNALEAGDFLYVAGDEDIRFYDLSAASDFLLIDGSASNFFGDFGGIDLVERTTTVGGTTLNAGKIVAVSMDDAANMGTNAVSILQEDVFVLDVHSSNTTATVERLMEGADFGFNDAHDWDGLSLATVTDLADLDIQTAMTTGGGLSINQDGGNDAYLSTDADVLDGHADLTLEFQFSDLQATGGIATLYSHFGTGSSHLAIEDDGTIDLNLEGISYKTIGTYSEVFGNGDHHLAVSWDTSAGNLRFYVDGVYQETVASITSAGTGTNGTFVLGQDQDSNNGDFDVTERFAGVFRDVRVFSDLRTDAEIAASYHDTLRYDESGLVANWTFNDLNNRDGELTDTVSGRVLTIEHASGTGYATSRPELVFTVNENSLNGTVIGVVNGVDQEREDKIASLLAGDSNLRYSAETNKFYQINSSTSTWASAQSSAIATTLAGVSGQLLTIDSAAENKLAVSYAIVAGGNVWLGYSDQDVEGEIREYTGNSAGKLVWIGTDSGENVDGVYTNWAAGEPNDSGGEQDFGKLYWNGTWDDSNSVILEYSIFEWDADDVLDATDPLTYAITSQTVAGAFTIDASKGTITIADGSLLDYETDASHALTVRVTDVDLNTRDEVFTVTLNDLLESNNAPTDLSSGIELNTDGGNDSYLSLTDGRPVLGGLNQVTLEAKFQIDLIPNGNITIIDYQEGGVATEFGVAINPNGALQIVIEDAAPRTTAGVYSQLLDGNQHHLAVSWDNTNGDVQFYIDGEYVESITGVGTGHTLHNATATQLVVGQDPDDGADVYSNNVFSGTFYDVRVWKDVRSAAEISLNYQSKFNGGNLPTGLVANWQMDGFNGSSQVVDVVSGNNLSVRDAVGAGFTASTPVDDLHINENSADGSTVGYVLPHDPDVSNNVVSDGRFLATSVPATYQPYESPATMGAWQVVQNSVDLLGASYERTPLGGLGVDLNGVGPGVIEQTLTTEIGREYQVTFAFSGNWGSDDNTKNLRVSAGGTSTDFSVSEPDGWSETNMLWGHRTFTFVANSTSTTLQMRSMDVVSIDFATNNSGPVIGDVQVIEIPSAVSTILNNDPTLSYDAATDKFYRTSLAVRSWAAANSNAQGSLINGVAGNLVSIGSLYENDLIRQMAIQRDNDVWIGGTDQTTEGEFYWQSSTGDGDLFWTGGSAGSALGYDNWGPASPRNPGEAEDFAFLESTDGSWSNVAEGKSRYSVIEWDASEVLSNFTFSLIDDAGGRFGIDATTGKITVVDGSLLDYETATSHDVDVNVTDATGNSYTKVMTIAVDDVNENTAPVISSPGGTLPYTENSGPYLIGAAAVITDADGMDFSGGQLHLQLTSNGLAEDVLDIRNQGTVAGQIGISGSRVTYGGVLVGSYTGPVTASTELVVTFNSNATLAVVNAVQDNLTYENTSESPSTAVRTIEEYITDGDLGTSNTISGGIQPVPVNDAPLLDANGNLHLTTISEDDSSNGGNTVAEIIASDGGDRITDVDAGASEGIAIFSTAGVYGTWQYDAGSGWTDIGSVSISSTLLLGNTDRVRYVPDGDRGETATFIFAAWDQTTGTAGTKMDTSSFGGSTAFSEQTDSVNITVTDANDAPLVQRTASDAVASYDFESGVNSGISGAPDLTVNAPASVSASAGVSGSAGGLLFPDGDTDSSTHPVSISSIPGVATSGEFSFAADLRFDSGSGNRFWETIFSFGGGASDNNVWLGRDQSTNDLHLTAYNGSTELGNIVVADALLDVEAQWLHAVVSLDATGQLSIYIDGVLAGSTNIGGTPDYSTWDENYIGSSNWAADKRFQGAIDNIAIFDSAISANGAADLAAGIPIGSGPLRYTENDPATAIQPRIALSDVDDTNLESATIAITAGFQTGEDVLAFTDQNGITGVWDSGAGVLSLSGTATVEKYQTALQSITYENLSGTPSPTDRTVSWSASDGSDTSNVGVRTIEISLTNDAPVMTAYAPDYNTTEDSSAFYATITALLGSSVSDPDVGAVEGIAVYGLTGAAGTLEYSVDAGSSWQTFSGLSKNNAILLGAADQIRFIPDGENGGTMALDYFAWDQTSGSAGDGVAVNTRGGTTAFSTANDTVTIDVTSNNDEQVVTTNTGATFFEGSSGNTITPSMLKTTDVDNSNSELLYSLIGSTSHGLILLDGSGTASFTQADIDAGRITYLHDGSENFADSFSFTVDDGTGATSSGTFNITLTPINDQAVTITSDGGGPAATISVNETVSYVAQVTVSDGDLPGDTITYAIIGGTDRNDFSIDASGNLTFNAAPDFQNPHDDDTDNTYDITVQVSDGVYTDNQSITVIVQDVQNTTLNVTTTSDVDDAGLGTSYTIEELYAVGGGTDGEVSLREAIIAANNTLGQDTINFSMLSTDAGYTGTAGTDAYWQISLIAALPTITESVILDGTSQTVFGGNVNPGSLAEVSESGTNAQAIHDVERPEIAIVGTAGFNGLVVGADNVTVQGFSMYGYSSHAAIYIQDAVLDTVIDSNVFGVAPTGIVDPGSALNSFNHVQSVGADYGTLSNNILAYSKATGFHASNASDNWTVSGNQFINSGYNYSNGDAIAISGSTGGTIDGNYIAGSSTQAILLEGSSTGITIRDNTVVGNGVGPTSGSHVQYDAIALRSGTNDITLTHNVIVDNYGAGILINDGAYGITITQNSIDGNGSVLSRKGDPAAGIVGIDLQGTGENADTGTAPYYTVNDAGDADAGGNSLQNFPVITSAVSDGSQITIDGTIHSLPNITFTLEFFDSAEYANGHGQGRTYLGSIDVTTGASGNATFNATLTAFIAASDFVTATATNLTTNETSEFAAQIVINGPVYAADNNGHFVFDGDDMITIEESFDLIMTDTMTMEAWIKPEDSILTRVVLNKEGEYEVGVGDNGNLWWAFANSDPGWVWHDTGVAVSTTQWSHIAVSYDNGTVNSYINGELVESYAGSGSISDLHSEMDDLVIGGRLNIPTDQYFVGGIDDVRIWDVARTQTEIQANLTAPLAGTETGLVGYYPFTRPDTLVRDASTAGNNGVLGSTTQTPTWHGITLTEDATYTVAGVGGVLANDIDLDGDSLSVTEIEGNASSVGNIHTLASGATVILAADGGFSYDPGTAFQSLDDGESATDTFTYTVTDNNGNSDTATVTLTITGTNDSPIAIADGSSQEYAEEVNSLDPVGYWRLDEPSGTTAVDQTGSHDGTYVGAVLGSGGALANSTTGAEFGNSGDQIDLGDFNVAGTGITMMGWINADDFVVDDGRIISKSEGIAEADHDWMLSTYDNGSDNVVRMRINVGGVTQTLIGSSGVLTAGQWYFVVGTYDVATRNMNLYLDGELVATAQHSQSGPVATSSRNVTIGSNADGYGTLNGRIDEVAVYDKALTIGAIQKIHQLGTGYTFDEDTTLNVDAANGVLANDTDVENDPLIANLETGPTNASSFTLNSDGSFSYTANADFHGTDTFTYRADDGTSQSAVTTVTIKVNSVNDAPTFNFDDGGGVVAVDFGLGDDRAYNTLIQPDGKVILTGFASNGTNTDFGLVRLNADGSLDTSFGTGGKVITPVGSDRDEGGIGVALQSDGKIVMVGIIDQGADRNVGIVRYNTDGSLDATFGTGGIEITDFVVGEDKARGVAIQDNGKIVVTGSSHNGSYEETLVARYNADGTLDTTFDTNGYTTVNVGSDDNDGVGILVQSDGKIVISGSASNGTNNDLLLIRLNSNGSLDNTFDTDGIVTTDFGGKEFGGRIQQQPDGKYIVGGYTDGGVGGDFAVARYNTDGSLDATFGASGKVTTSINAGVDQSIGVAVQSDGKILLSGYTEDSGRTELVVVRYNTDGTLDAGFATAGVYQESFSGTVDMALQVVVQADGKIIASGATHNGIDTDFLAVRLNTDGTLDTSFVGDLPPAPIGVTVDFGFGNDVSYNSLIQPDGKVILSGFADNGSDSDFAVVRLNADGTLDTSFGTGGKVMTDVDGDRDEGGIGVALQSDGKIVMVGTIDQGFDRNFGIVRYNADGTLDGSFGTAGIQITDFSADEDKPFGVAIQADGKLIVTGKTFNGSHDETLVARYSSSGSLDTSFGTGGYTTINIASDDSEGAGIIAQSDGKIVISGHGSNGTDNDFLLIRLTSNGSLDTSFDSDGIVTTDFGAVEFGARIELQSDGKYVVAGYTSGGVGGDFVVARYNADGSLDASFGTGGKVTTSINAGADESIGIAIQSDGKILLSGYTEDSGRTDMVVVRYNTDGSLDSGFASGGVYQESFSGTADMALQVAVQADGKIIANGSTHNGTDTDFFAIRLNDDGTFDSSFGIASGSTPPTYVEGGSPVVLDGNVDIFDAELSAIDDFGGSTLTLTRDGGIDPEDAFSATGNLMFNAGTLELSSSSMGSYSNSAGVLTLTFAAGTTNAEVNEVMQSIAYANSSDTPQASVQINWTFNDSNRGAQGSGGPLQAVGSTKVQITATNDAPIVVVDGHYTISEGDSFNFSAIGSSDPDGDTLAYNWDLDNDGQYDDFSSIGGGLTWAELGMLGIDDDGIYTVGVQVDDGNGGVATDSTTLTIHNVAPDLSVAGNTTVNGGDVYTLNFSAVDPGDDTIIEWVVNWGDGTRNTYAGGSTSATHTYSTAATGLTYDILVSATDEDGTFTNSDLFAGTYDGTSIQIQKFNGNTGENTILTTGSSSVAAVFGRDGFLYATEADNHRIVRIDPDSGTRTTFIASGTGGMNLPSGIVFNQDGNLLVTAYASNQILMFDGTTGAYLLDFNVADVLSTTGVAVNGPESVVVGPDGFAYVGEYDGNRVLRFDATTGDFIDEVLTGLGNLEQIIIGPGNDLFITEYSGGTSAVILRYDLDTSTLSTFITSGSGGLTNPAGIAFGPDGNLYVSDLSNEVIRRYDGNTGAFIDTFSTASGKTEHLAWRPDHQVTVTNQAPTIDLDDDDSSGAIGADYTTSFTEGNGPVAIVDSDAVLTDLGDVLQSLTITLTNPQDGANEGLSADTSGTGISIAYDPGSGVMTLSGSDSVANYLQVLKTATYNNTSDAPNTTTRSFTIVANDGITNSNTAVTEVAINAVNDIPTLTAFAAPVDSTSEDTEVELTFAELRAQGDEADSDGTVDAFIVKSITSGTLKIGTSAGTATAWAAGTNDTIDATHKAYWTPAANVNGTIGVFEVVAKDNDGAQSTTNVAVQVNVTDVNDIPTLTAFATPVDTTNEDTEVELTFAELTAQGDEADSDGTVDAFVVKSITSGTLKIGSSAGTATAWATGTNDTIDATNKAYWTPTANANGTVGVFEVVAKDNDGAESTTNVAVQVSVSDVNDIPTLTAFAAPVDSTSEDTEVELTIAELRAQGDEDDSDGTVDAFVVKSITSGTLKIGSSAGTATAWAAGTNDTIDATNKAYWTPAANANGTIGVFEVVAKDNDGAESTTNVAVQVNVTDVNDIPTLTAFATPVDTTSEDTEVELTFAELTAQGDEDDSDGTIDAFIVKSITSGTLKIGSSAGTATTWAAGTNDIINATNKAYWTPTANANGTIGVFEVVTKDNDGAESTTNVAVQVNVTDVNDIPTLTAFATPVDTTSEDTEVELTFAELTAQGDEADSDGTIDAFIVKSITSGTLKIGSSAGTATTWAAGTNDIINATNKAYWTPTANANGTIGVFEVVAKDNDGAESTTNVTVQVSVSDVNDIPTLTALAAPVDSTSEDTEVELTFAELTAQGDEDDSDGSVDAFVVKSITSGTLKIGSSAGTATAWAAGTNDTIDATNKAYWTPAANANGTIGVFEVVAKDNDGAESTTNVAVQVNVTDVNDIPTLTAFATPVDTTSEDTEVELTFAELTAQGDEADSDGTVDAFVVKSITSGTLKIGSSAGTATAWATGTNDTIDATNKAYWTPAANANGTIGVFEVVAQDDDGSQSTTNVAVQVNVTPVNDEEMLTTNTNATVSRGSLGNVVTRAMLETTDIDNTAEQLEYTVTTATSNGTLKRNGAALGLGDTFTQADIDAGLITYDHNGSPTVNDHFDFSVDDSSGTISGSTFHFTVTSSNSVPVANPDSFSVDNDSVLHVDSAGILSNDIDVDGDTLSVTMVTGPTHGTLTLAADGSFTYTPTISFSGIDTFSYTVNDGFEVSAAAVVSITVNEVLAAPAPGSEPEDSDDSNDSDDSDTTDDPDPTDESDEQPLLQIVNTPDGLVANPNDTTEEVIGIPFILQSPEVLISAMPTDLPTDPDAVHASGLATPSVFRDQGISVYRSETISSSLLLTVFDSGSLYNQLDSVIDDLETHNHSFDLVAGSTIVASGAISVGFVVWAARASYFVTMLSTSMPAWAMIDPVPVLDAEALAKRTEKRVARRQEKSLADIVDEKPVPVSVTLLDEHFGEQGATFEALTRDISDEDMNLICQQPMTAGNIRLRMTTPDGKEMDALGGIRHCTAVGANYHVGVSILADWNPSTAGSP